MGDQMSYHLRPEIQARLETHAAALGMSADEYLEALVKRDLRIEEPATNGETDSGMIVEENGLHVYRTGEPMPPSLVEDTLDAIRREREASFLGNIPR